MPDYRDWNFLLALAYFPILGIFVAGALLIADKERDYYIRYNCFQSIIFNVMCAFAVVLLFILNFVIILLNLSSVGIFALFIKISYPVAIIAIIIYSFYLAIMTYLGYETTIPVAGRLVNKFLGL